MQQNMFINVYVIPGGEGAAGQAYDGLVTLLEEHEDLFLSVYRGINRANGSWVLTLIGEKTSCDHYLEQIQCPLESVQAQLISVPPESLTPLIESFLTSQAEMAAKKTTFLVKHHPMSKKHYRQKKGHQGKKS